MNWNLLDVIGIAIIIFAAIRCTFRGFIKEIMSMAALILGVLCAVFFSKAGAVLLDTYVGFSRWNQIIAFLGIFLLVYVIVKLTERLLRGLLEKIRLEKLDRALGFFLGLTEGIIVVVFIVYLLRVQPLLDVTEVLDQSLVADLILDIVPIFTPEPQAFVSGTYV